MGAGAARGERNFKKPGFGAPGNECEGAPIRVGVNVDGDLLRSAGPWSATGDQAKRKRGWTQLLA